MSWPSMMATLRPPEGFCFRFGSFVRLFLEGREGPRWGGEREERKGELAFRSRGFLSFSLSLFLPSLSFFKKHKYKKRTLHRVEGGSVPSDAAADDDEVVIVLAAARGGGGGRGEGEGAAGGAVFFVVVVIFYSVSVASVCVSSRSLLLFSERGNVDAAGSPARARESPPPPRRSQGAKKKNEEEVEKQRLEARRVSGRSIAQRVFLFFPFSCARFSSLNARSVGPDRSLRSSVR